MDEPEENEPLGWEWKKESRAHWGSIDKPKDNGEVIATLIAGACMRAAHSLERISLTLSRIEKNTAPKKPKPKLPPAPPKPVANPDDELVNKWLKQ